MADEVDIRFWNVYSVSYDAITSSIPYRRHLDVLIDALDLTGGEHVLDLGCGTGNLECRVAERCPDVHAVGLDYSPAMLAKARRKCGGARDVRFLQADLSNPLPFPPESFDRVVANNTLYALPDKRALLAEVARVLRPAGRVVISDPKPGARVSRVVSAHFRALAALPIGRRAAAYAGTIARLSVAGFVPIAMSALVIGGRLRRGGYSFSSDEEMSALMAEFADVCLSDAYAGQSWLVSGVKVAAELSLARRDSA